MVKDRSVIADGDGRSPYLLDESVELPDAELDPPADVDDEPPVDPPPVDPDAGVACGFGLNPAAGPAGLVSGTLRGDPLYPPRFSMLSLE